MLSSYPRVFSGTKGRVFGKKEKEKKKEAILTESPERETKRKKESRVEVFRVE